MKKPLMTLSPSGSWITITFGFMKSRARRSRMVNPAYEASFFIAWDQAANQYNCIWLDNTGGISRDSFGNAKRSGDEIAFTFKDKDGVSQLTFRYNAQSDSWEWRLASGENDAEPFALVKLIKLN